MALPNNCPLCYSGLSHQSVVTSHVYGQDQGRGHAFFHCQSCDIFYQYPRLNQNEETQFYLQNFMKKYHKNVFFCILCNLKDNINEIIQSLCVCYLFKPLNFLDYKNIIKKQYQNIDNDKIYDIYNITCYFF